MISRYRLLVSFEREAVFELVDPTGHMIKLSDCIVAEQDDMMMGDSLDGLNEQIQRQIKNDGPFDVMILLKEKNKKDD